MVEKHIKSLLYDHDCVIVPDFGGLIARYVSARIHPMKHSLVPPSKRIAFNEKLVLNDGLLISTIAYKDGIDKGEAQRLVAEFVAKAKARLEEENRFELSDIGIFRYTAERRLEFEYVEGDNLLESSFGLPDLVARPIKLEDPAVLRTLLKEREQVPVNTKLPLRKRIQRAYRVAASLTVVGLSASALYLLSLQADYNLSSLTPISLSGIDFDMGEHKAVSKYVDNYIPITEDERATAYEVILPSISTHAEQQVSENTEAVIMVDASIHDGQEDNESVSLAEVDKSLVAEDDKPAAEAKVIPAVEKEELTIKEKTGRFYIITGGYSRLENAEVGQKEVNKKGYSAKVLLPGRGSRLFRVSAADFATREEAQAALMTYKKSLGETIWVLNN